MAEVCGVSNAKIVQAHKQQENLPSILTKEVWYMVLNLYNIIALNPQFAVLMLFTSWLNLHLLQLFSILMFVA